MRKPIAIIMSLVALALGEYDIGNVFRRLQWKRIDLLDLGDKQNISSIKNVVKGASRAEILVSGTYLYKNFTWKSRSFSFEALVCVCDGLNGLANFEHVLRNAQFSPERLMLLTNFQWFHPGTFFESLNMSRSFFWHEFNSSSDFIKRIQTVRNQYLYVLNIWHKKRHIYDRVYDFQGAPFAVLAPAQDYYSFNEPMFYNLCPHNHDMACNATGHDFRLISMLQRRLNFTLEIYLQKDNDWGSVTANGNMGIIIFLADNKESNCIQRRYYIILILGDRNATYSGVLGGIVHDKYDMASSYWETQTDRLQVLDFTIPFHYFTFGYATAVGATGLDWHLYLRPFTKQLWIVCAGLFVVTLLTYQVTGLNANKMQKCDAKRLVAFCGCLSFILTKAYYEGALTMFFTTTSKIQPKTLDVFNTSNIQFNYSTHQ